MESLDTDDAVVADELARDRRWPDFARRVTEETSVRSMMSVRLTLQGDARAAMNFYAESSNAFIDLDVAAACLLAPFVALSVQLSMAQQRIDNLEVALGTSRLIGSAMGIWMARRLITSDDAFTLLRQASQQLNRKLRDVAAEVTETGTLPQVPEPEHRGDR